MEKQFGKNGSFFSGNKLAIYLLLMLVVAITGITIWKGEGTSSLDIKQKSSLTDTVKTIVEERVKKHEKGAILEERTAPKAEADKEKKQVIESTKTRVKPVEPILENEEIDLYASTIKVTVLDEEGHGVKDVEAICSNCEESQKVLTNEKGILKMAYKIMDKSTEKALQNLEISLSKNGHLAKISPTIGQDHVEVRFE